MWLARSELLVELAPLLLRPAQLLHRGREVEEVHRDDRRTGSEVGVADQSVQLTTGLYQAGMDGVEALGLLRGVAVPVGQGALLGRSGPGMAKTA